MINRKLSFICALAMVAMCSLQARSANVDVATARVMAGDFITAHSASHQGRFNATRLSEIQLAHVEASSQVNGANDYYAFNVKGGGFIIISGEDRAARVLGYSEQGHLDFNNLPYNLKGLLDSYKREIEYLQIYKGDDLVPVHTNTSLQKVIGVEPLISTNWGQELPYCLQCPVYQNEYCVVGCVATAMAQVMKFWEYPTSCNGVSSYYCYDIHTTLQALPATTFDYSKMLPSYCHWDYEYSQLVQDLYTDEQAQEVAKLSRYCGQAVEMGYSPEGSGAYTSDQLAAMKQFGYSSNAQYVTKSGWWSSNYTTSEWEAMMKAELNAGRPILYAANDPAAGGHAFICDGYNNDNYFHFNFGWYGTCDGWYLSTALNMTHRDGDELKFNSGHEMLTGITPPNYIELAVESISANDQVMILGDNMAPQANNITLRTSYQTVRLVFALTDDQDNVVTQSNAFTLSRVRFEQGSNVLGALTLPTTLQTGTYNMALYYYLNTPTQLVPVQNVEAGKLEVVGRLAKYNAPFTITDVTELVTKMLDGSDSTLTITDVTTLIEYILGN